MVTIIGTKGCSRCYAVKAQYEKKQIDYTYKLLNELPEEQQEELLCRAEQKHITSFPLILDESGEIITE